MSNKSNLRKMEPLNGTIINQNNNSNQSSTPADGIEQSLSVGSGEIANDHEYTGAALATILATNHNSNINPSIVFSTNRVASAQVDAGLERRFIRSNCEPRRSAGNFRGPLDKVSYLQALLSAKAPPPVSRAAPIAHLESPSLTTECGNASTGADIASGVSGPSASRVAHQAGQPLLAFFL